MLLAGMTARVGLVHALLDTTSGDRAIRSDVIGLALRHALAGLSQRATLCGIKSFKQIPGSLYRCGGRLLKPWKGIDISFTPY